MDSNWLMPSSRVRVHGYTEGERPSGSSLMALVDQTDPAFLSIIAVLHEMRSAGVDLDEVTVKAAVAIGRARHKPALQRAQAPDAVPDETGASSIVYYVRRADLVKIGTTRHPHERFAALLPDEILAWEPGTHATERMRHHEFAEWRLGGSEYFEMTEVLGSHVDRLRRLHGDPAPEWPTLARVRAIGTRAVEPLATPDASGLVSLSEGVEALGIKRNTADMWVRRKQLVPAGTNSLGRPLYLLSHMRQLAARSGLVPHAVA